MKGKPTKTCGISKQDSMWFRNVQLSKPGSRILVSQTIGSPNQKIRSSLSEPIEAVRDRKRIDVANGRRRAFEASIEVKRQNSFNVFNQLWSKEEKFRSWKSRRIADDIKAKQVAVYDEGILEHVRDNWDNGIRHPKLRPEKSTLLDGNSQIYLSKN